MKISTHEMCRYLFLRYGTLVQLRYSLVAAIYRLTIRDSEYHFSTGRPYIVFRAASCVAEVQSLPTFKTGKLQGAQDAVCPHMLRVGVEKHYILTYVEQVSECFKRDRNRERSCM